jgi:hypothetical protein
MWNNWYIAGGTTCGAATLKNHLAFPQNINMVLPWDPKIKNALRYVSKDTFPSVPGRSCSALITDFVKEKT